MNGPPDNRMPFDAGLAKCRCGKVGYETEDDAILCAPPGRFDTYQCGQGWWHVTTDNIS